MRHWLAQPWPWYVSGPLLGLSVPLLLWLGNRSLGFTSSLRAMCAATIPGKIEFFRYDWRRTGFWNVALAAGVLLGGFLAVTLLGGGNTPQVSESTRAALVAIGTNPPAGLVPAELFSWNALLTVRGAIAIIGGGFLVGFGGAYAGGCTSGHGILGLATRQAASVLALVAIFAGGLLATFVLLPLLFR